MSGALKVVWHSFEGRYSDSSRVLFERWLGERPDDSHTWLVDPRHLDAFPAGVKTVTIYGPECAATLEAADVLVANTHTDIDWRKTPDTLYVQIWHGTPLKRIHHDVLWAPAGRLDRLSRDVQRWDLLVSPNPASTSRLRGAFRYDGDVVETGYPRNDLLTSPQRAVIREEVRAALGIASDVRAILYTPTWRDDQVFTVDESPIAIELDPAALLKQLGPGHCFLIRSHPLVGERLAMLGGEGVIDVSRYHDITELYLAADVMVTDYSSTMFDFAVTGKPLIFYVYDLDRFRDTVRGFYFDLADEAPGPLVATQDALASALHKAPEVAEAHAAAYACFRDRYCCLEDGHATDRLLRHILERLPQSVIR